MSRTKQELVDFYAKGLLEFADLSPTQYHAVHTALAFACSEIQDNLHAVYMKQLDGAMTLHNQVAALQQSKQEAEEEIDRLCSQLQALEAKQVPAPTIHLNGTHPSTTVQTAVLAAKALLDAIPEQAADQQAIPFDAEAAQEAAAAEAQPDPTTAVATNRRPAEYKWPTLDDVSLEIVTALDRKRRQWQSVMADDKRIIVLAMIGELGQDLPPGETLSIETFNRHKPRWMPTFPSVSTALGMTWKQMLAAAPQL